MNRIILREVRHVGSDQQRPGRLERGSSWSEHEAQNLGWRRRWTRRQRYARSAKFVEVVKGLWDSWDDGALLFDKVAGRYFDEEKMHVLNHQGRFFKVLSRLNVARMPQGHPVMVQAGASNKVGS